MVSDERKTYIMDTSVLIHDPCSLVQLARGNKVVIPIWVVEELDGLKRHQDNRGANSREVSRFLDEYSVKGDFFYEVEKNQGEIIFGYGPKNNGFKKLPVGLDQTNDNRIILVARSWQAKEGEAIIITKDINLRIKARACGIEAQDYESDKMIRSVREFYSGFTRIEIGDEMKGYMNIWYREEMFKVDDLEKFTENELASNQCCLISAGEKSILGIYKKSINKFRLVKKTRLDEKDKKKIKPINMEQIFAYALMIDPDISIVSLVGKAGTGKTLMALLAGYEQLDERYERILIYRPNIEIGQPLGFLPGDVEEKFSPWMEPILDNLRLIIKDNGKDYTGKHKECKSDFSILGEMVKNKLIDISPINFARGRSLNNTFVIIDEAQNIRPKDMKTLITRMGRGSKVILNGDVEQVDDPYLDGISNGLSHLIHKFKGDEVFGHIILTKGERSLLAEKAARLL